MTIDHGTIQLRNINYPFTELFSVIARKDFLAKEFSNSYTSLELKVMYQHIDNAMIMLLQGLQDVGSIMGIVMQSRKQLDDLRNIGFFISGVSNLVEALTVLREDVDYMLQQAAEAEH